MIVEDEFLISQELQARLESLGYDVIAVADSAEEAVERARIDKPQVALMDIRLQGEMSGIEAAAILHQELGIPCIFVTAHAGDEILDEAARTEHSGYLIKPYRDKELQAALEAALYKAKAERERRQVLDSLRKSLEDGKRLTGILAICSECKRIRNEEGVWQDIERYVREHSQATFSHSLCPVCVKKLYPDLWEKLRREGLLE
ncbi:hypothetical protein AAU61_13775 [Desulfocarbo indianensis]|nr:hypothetical protein AAU61_13775 [Desulfocarbo indianensis]